MKIMNSSTRIILLATLLSSFHSIFAAGKITDSNFMVDLGLMDPVAHESASIPTGRWALFAILESFSEILLFAIPIIAVISIIIAGYFYVFSSGDAEKANRGKTIIKWNIVAMLVAFFSWTLVQLVASFFA